jgi:glutaredoxin 3
MLHLAWLDKDFDPIHEKTTDNCFPLPSSLQVMVFAKSYCPHCQSTRSLLKTLKASVNVEATVLDLDLMDDYDGPLVQMELLERTGQRTVPNVFIGTKHIGGNSDLQQLASEGKLPQMLNDVLKARSV